jgi:hypothetical protein
MPRFVTISPTHVAGEKRNTWARFRDGKYIAIGWLVDTDLSSWSREAISAELEKREEPSWRDGQHDLTRFVHDLEIGDMVAITNTNTSILGVGIITSDYYFDATAHDTGDARDKYTHFRAIRWLSTDEWMRSDVILPGETSWEPRGTLGRINPSVPAYVWRRLNLDASHHFQNDLSGEETRQFGGSGAGFQSDPARRRAVETFAVELAVSHYESKGYDVEEKGRPFDLLCRKGSEELKVEVKGTETQADYIILTKNEVNCARAHSMELFVVDSVQSSQEANGAWKCDGGQVTVIQPWKPEEKRLEVLSYTYRLL